MRGGHGTRRRFAAQRGAVSAEYVAFLVLVGALVAGLWAVAIPSRVGDAAATAADCLFTVDSDACDLPAVDAEGGDDEDDTPPAPPRDRDVTDGNNGDSRGEGDAPTGNDEVDALYEHFGAYLDYLWEEFGRDSYDDRGAPLVGQVNMPVSGGAYWDPAAQEMVYSPGFAVLDVTAHELTHAMIEHTAGLVYQDESGALNEAIADMFASNLDGNWEIGEGIPDGAIRDMSDPAAHGQPAHVDDYVDTARDHGGVHTNSGIPNHAYYHMVDGVGGLGRETSEQILYRALTEHLEPTSGFEDFRTACLEAAEELHGEGSDEVAGVDAAFAEVGLDGTWEAP